MRYCSLNAHQGHTQSRRDDLEAIGNIIVYFMKDGNLPWMRAEVRIPGGDVSKCRSFYEDQEREQLNIKENTTIESLCEDLPDCVYKYMTYVRNLRFEEKPNYKMLRGLFDELCLELNNSKPIDPDQKFDWYYQRQKILEDKAKLEIEEMEKQNIKTKKKQSMKPPTKKQELINAQKEIFKQQEEARQKQKENKKKKKIEAMEEEKLSKNSKEFQSIQKE